MAIRHQNSTDDEHMDVQGHVRQATLNGYGVFTTNHRTTVLSYYSSPFLCIHTLARLPYYIVLW